MTAPSSQAGLAAIRHRIDLPAVHTKPRVRKWRGKWGIWEPGSRVDEAPIDSDCDWNVAMDEANRRAKEGR